MSNGSLRKQKENISQNFMREEMEAGIFFQSIKFTQFQEKQKIWKKTQSDR